MPHLIFFPFRTACHWLCIARRSLRAAGLIFFLYHSQHPRAAQGQSELLDPPLLYREVVIKQPAFTAEFIFFEHGTSIVPESMFPPASDAWPVPLPAVGSDTQTTAVSWNSNANDLDAAEEILAPFESVGNLDHPNRGPPILDDPFENIYDLSGERPIADPLLRYSAYPPAGFTGSSSVMPSESQESSHFVPAEDR
ncbi:MAG: hypothetical protein WCI09_08655, partial [Planctomycetota bacterium]